VFTTQNEMLSLDPAGSVSFPIAVEYGLIPIEACPKLLLINSKLSDKIKKRFFFIADNFKFQGCF
jgi:Flp pilus assembly pilin Flp